MRSRFITWLAGALMLAVVTRDAAPRAAVQDDQAVKVTAGDATAPPSAPVAIALTLSAPDAVAVGSATLRITFPKAQLAFVKLDPSGLALGVDAVVHSEVKKGPTSATSVLEATISTIDEGGARKAIPAGPLAYVSFKIDKDAKPETKLALTSEAKLMTTDTPAKAIPTLPAAKMTVTVSTPPVSICFFYMH